MNKTLDTILANIPTTTLTTATSAADFKKLVKSNVRAGSCVSNPEGRCAGGTGSCGSSTCGSGGSGCGGGCGGCGGGVGAGGSL